MRNRIIVNLEKIKSNLEVVKCTLPKKTDIIAVVKANAYGHGYAAVSEYLEKSCGIKRFAVAGIDEAVKLRKCGISGEILVLSYVALDDIQSAIDNNIIISIISPEHAVEVSKLCSSKGQSVRAHLKLNTGMNRVGFDCKTFKQLVAIAGAYRLPGIKFEGIFSHFSSSDDTSSGADPYTKLQLERFEKVLAYLSERGINPGLRHISNSGAIGKYPLAHFDAVRCGALMYGYNTAKDAPLPVQPVMEWRACISMVRTIDFGDAVSYSRKFVAKGPLKIATLCIGYADGLPRSLTNKGTVIINGKKCRSLGAICMDQMMVDVSRIEAEIKMGDEAIIIGPGQSADDLADAADTCMHDILSSIADRVQRDYPE